MTDDQRELLETFAGFGVPAGSKAVAAALAEIDRLRAELALGEPEDGVIREALDACEAADSHEAVVAANAIRYLRAQLRRARAELASSEAQRIAVRAETRHSPTHGDQPW